MIYTPLNLENQIQRTELDIETIKRHLKNAIRIKTGKSPDNDTSHAIAQIVCKPTGNNNIQLQLNQKHKPPQIINTCIQELSNYYIQFPVTLQVFNKDE